MAINGWTIALQAINFLVLVWLLHRLLYKPVLAVIARRKALVEDAFSEAEKAKEAATAEQQSYQEAQTELAQSRQEYLSKAHAEIESDRTRVLEDANAQVLNMVEDARRLIATERDAALSDTRAQVADLAVEMAADLLRQAVARSPSLRSLNDAFREQLFERLDELTAEERLSLQEDLQNDSEGLAIVTATAIAEDEQSRWKQTLQDRIGAAKNLTFIVEPNLIGGVELRFPHAVMSLGWSELLRQGRAALLADEIDH